MSINSAVLKEGYQETIARGEVPFLLEQDEVVKFRTQTSRNTFKIASLELNSRKISIAAGDGYLFLTNQRFVFVTLSTGDIDTFHVVLQNSKALHFTHRLVSPWFGANYWEFLFFSAQSVSNGLPPNEWFKGTVLFNDGGLFNFIPEFDRVLNDATNNSHIDEELPRYSET